MAEMIKEFMKTQKSNGRCQAENADPNEMNINSQAISAMNVHNCNSKLL